ncbi:MAG: hypothetical protein AMJ53_03075 [Gammaproteobacteria bacterium SG8_11]|nr:MAG: hypothetical protein AMJ53_03075 [Gammaproteobacteria bacterium SG8_11]
MSVVALGAFDPAGALSPCVACGACCAFYRVSFYWAEADAGVGSVPAELTEQVTCYHSAMKGTAGSTPRCVALQGIVGEHVYCNIYSQRPSVCRDFSVAWENGKPNELCDKARAAWGMLPLLPPHPIEPDTPKAA